MTRTYPAEVRLRLVLSQEFLRTRLEEDEDGGRGEERRSLPRASDEGEWRLLSKSAISLQNGPTDTDCGRTDGGRHTRRTERCSVTTAIKYRVGRIRGLQSTDGKFEEDWANIELDILCDTSWRNAHFPPT